MTYFDLPKQEMTGYSPLSFKELIFKKALEQEKGTEDEKVSFILDSKNKNKELNIIENNQSIVYKYKNIMEMYYSSIYALAINKSWRIKHQIISSDSPDIIFINSEDENDRVAIEVYENFDYEKKNDKFIIDVKKDVEEVLSKKGTKVYPIPSRLLIINRKQSTENGFNVSQYAEEINKCKWNFSNIIIALFTKSSNNFTFFHIYPPKMKNCSIDFSLNKDKALWY